MTHVDFSPLDRVMPGLGVDGPLATARISDDHYCANGLISIQGQLMVFHVTITSISDHVCHWQSVNLKK